MHKTNPSEHTPAVGAKAVLSGRDRVNRMIERRDHDRVPRHDTYWKETIARWQREGMGGDAYFALRMLGSDFQGLAGASPAPWPGRDETISEDELTRTYVDGWGATVRYWKNRSGTPEHVAFGCNNREEWESIYRPLIENVKIPVNVELTRQRFAEGREYGRWCFLSTLESFEATRRIMGDVNTLMAMAEDPQWVADVSRVYTDAVLRVFDDILLTTEVEPDGLWVYGDMAYNHATMCSPAMYRELIWPDHKRLADWAHDHGMKFIFHTDGDVKAVIDMYLEAGVDCLQPLEAKAGMDVRKLCPQYGDRLSFFGNIDVMVMGTNDLDLIEREMQTKLEAGMATKGYAYHSDHSVPPQVSLPTYRHIISLLDKYGNYA